MRRPLAWGLLLSLLLAACTSRPAHDDAPVPAPDLTGMEPQVASLLARAREAVLREPGSAAAWGELGSLYDAHVMTDLAEACYRRARELDPRDFRWTYLLAIAREIEGADAREVAERFGEAARLRPDYAPVRVRLGDALWKRGLPGEARAELERALALAPHDAMARRRLGQVLLSLGDAKGARPHLEAAVLAVPNDLVAHTALAQAYGRLGLAAQAAEEVARARGLEPVNVLDDPVYGEQVFARSVSSSRTFARAMAALQAGAYAPASADLEIVVAARPDDASAHYWLGVAYARSGRGDEALGHLERAVALAPAMVQAHLELSRVLEALGRREEAQRHAREAARIAR